MRVTLAMRDMEPETFISNNLKIFLLMEELRYQLRHKPFDYLSCPQEMQGTDGTEIEGKASQWLAQLEAHAMRGSPHLTLPGG